MRDNCLQNCDVRHGWRFARPSRRSGVAVRRATEGQCVGVA